MPRIALAAAFALAVVPFAGCSHHHLHHIYNEPHEHNAYNTPDHPGDLHDTDDHRDVAHDHEHFGGNEK